MKPREGNVERKERGVEKTPFMLQHLKHMYHKINCKQNKDQIYRQKKVCYT